MENAAAWWNRRRTEDEAKHQAFLAELTELTKKHGLVIAVECDDHMHLHPIDEEKVSHGWLVEIPDG